MSAVSPFRPNVLAKQSTDTLIAARDLVSTIIDERARQTSLFEAPVKLTTTALQLVPRPSPIAYADTVPDVLSPSTASKFMDCSARWFYSKMLQLPDPRTAALALGSAVHEVVAVNMQDKIETRRDLDAAAISSLFRDALPRQLEGVVFAEGESADELAGCGEALLSVYMDQAAPSIRPQAVELAVEGDIGGVRVHGFVDVLDVEGTVIDLKTAGKKPSGVSSAHRLQVATYAMITPGASGRARIDTITKTKTVAHHSTSFDVTAADRKLTERLYSITLDQMRSGLVVPNRSSFLCSRKNCAFWETCEQDYGGAVA